MVTINASEPEKKSGAKNKLAAKKELFANKEWYKNQEGKEEEFIGILHYIPPVKGVIGFNRSNPYRLELLNKKESREVHVGGDIAILKEYDKKKVKLIGKEVRMEVEGTVHNEIWPAFLELVKDKDPS